VVAVSLKKLRDATSVASVATEARLAELDAANIPSDLSATLADTNELQGDLVNGGRLDLLFDSILTYAISSAAWGSINSGIVFRGVVTADDPGVSFTIAGLAGQGVGAFVDANTPWYAYVCTDGGGASAAPQGEVQKVTGYTSATGLFTTDAFTVAVATGDDVVIMSGRIAAIPEIKAVTDLFNFSGTNVLAKVMAEDDIDFGATKKASLETAMDNELQKVRTEPSNMSATNSIANHIWFAFMRLYHKNTQTATEQKTFGSNGTSTVATRTTSDDGTTQTIGAAS
jgi:hypothetical protein